MIYDEDVPKVSWSVEAVASIFRPVAKVPCLAASINMIRAVFRQLTFSKVSVSTDMEETSRAK